LDIKKFTGKIPIEEAFWESQNSAHYGNGAYSELILVASHSVLGTIKGCRLPQMAFISCANLDVDTKKMIDILLNMVSTETQRKRYERVIVLGLQKDKQIENMESYISSLFPDLLAYRRVYRSLMKTIGEYDFYNALGSARPVIR